MITLKKLRTIARAKFSDKSNLGDWYQKRLEICSQCPYNSANKVELSIRDKAVLAANLGKDSCLACTCEIDAKASVREETCGLIKIKQAPLWEALPNIEVTNFQDFHVENLNADKVKILFKGELHFDYGVIKYNSDTSFDFSIKDKKNLITQMTAQSSCLCTVPTPKKVGDTYFINVKYDSKRLGRIDKIVTLKVIRGGKPQNIKFKIIGTVIK